MLASEGSATTSRSRFFNVTECRGYLTQESVAGGAGQDGQGLVDRVVSEKCLDCVTVFLDDGLIEFRVQRGGQALLQQHGAVGHQVSASPLGYVSHENGFRARACR